MVALIPDKAGSAVEAAVRQLQQDDVRVIGLTAPPDMEAGQVMLSPELPSATVAVLANGLYAPSNRPAAAVLCLGLSGDVPPGFFFRRVTQYLDACTRRSTSSGDRSGRVVTLALGLKETTVVEAEALRRWLASKECRRTYDVKDWPRVEKRLREFVISKG